MTAQEAITKAIEAINSYDGLGAPVDARIAISDVKDAVRGTDGYWRGTNRKAEYAEVKAGKQIVSTNHLDGSRESGMSVSKSLADVWLSGFSYCYRVDGDVVGSGSDGEPVLANVRVISAMYKGENAIADDDYPALIQAAYKEIANNTEWSVERIRQESVYY